MSLPQARSHPQNQLWEVQRCWDTLAVALGGHAGRDLAESLACLVPVAVELHIPSTAQGRSHHTCSLGVVHKRASVVA